MAAQAAKEKGNLAFKAGDFPSAIGHYTAATLADPSDPTFPLNRAAAYLKLEKFHDAERDCTTVLRLAPNHVKAFFRRGQARVGLAKLEEAKKDFTDALSIEPANASARQELENVVHLIQSSGSKAKGKQKKPAPSSSALPSTSSPEVPPKQRRRVPIRIVGQESSSSASTSTSISTPAPAPAPKPQQPSILEPVSTRALTNEKNAPATTTAISSKGTPVPGLYRSTNPSSHEASTKGKETDFQKAKEARDASKPSFVNGQSQPPKVGGGIFRRNGESVVFKGSSGGDIVPAPVKKKEEEEEESTSTSHPHSPPSDAIPQPPLQSQQKSQPQTLFELVRVWDGIASARARNTHGGLSEEDKEAVVRERWEVFCTIPPAQLPALCKTALEPSLLVSILDVFLSVLQSSSSSSSSNTQTTIRAYLTSFAAVARFNTLVMFLSRPEKALARDVWAGVGVHGIADLRGGAEGDARVGGVWKAIWS